MVEYILAERDNMTLEELVQACKEMDITLTSVQTEQLLRYASLLKEWNQKMNLTAIVEDGEILEKHFLDSIYPLADTAVQGSVCDVGSGAGFPGLVWKIVRPDLNITLLEPTGKRCTFLNAVIADLKLQQIQVVNARAEEFVKEKRESFDVVTARAVANLSLLSELCIPLVRVGGIFLSMKGSNGIEEKESAVKATTLLGCTCEEVKVHELDSGNRVNVIYRKTKATPAKYPRNYGQMKKKPLG